MVDQIKKIEIGDQCKDLADFLLNCYYEIPGYQRDYAWEKENFDDLIEDVIESRKRKSQHFFGVMMTMPKDVESDVRLVIDGQQRITTTLVYLKAAYFVIKSHGLSNQNLNSCNLLIRVIEEMCNGRILFDANRSQRLKISGNNNILFDLIMNTDSSKSEIDSWYSKKSSTKLPETTKRLYDAFKYFYYHFEKQLKKNTVEDFLNFVTEEVKFFLENFKVLVIPIQSQVFAYQFFQTVNDRGKNLVVTDIIKAYFHELCNGDTRAEQDIEKLWDKIVDNLGRSPTDTFLRHFWLSKYKVIKVADLYSEIKNEIEDIYSARNFLNGLAEESENYKVLLNFETTQKDLNEELKDIFLLAKNFVMPPILAAYGNFEGEKIVNFVKIITSFVFRYRTICHMENKNMERVLSQIAVAIRKEKNKLTLKKIVSHLKKIDVPDDQFKITFHTFKSRVNSLSKYILEKLEISMRGDKQGKPPWDPKMSVEHVLPKKYAENWTSFLSDQNFDAEEFIHRLGNLTLLTGALNSGLKNSFFDQKVKEIKKHDVYFINKSITEQHEWNDVAIETRHQGFAEIANKVWNLDKFK